MATIVPVASVQEPKVVAHLPILHVVVQLFVKFDVRIEALVMRIHLLHESLAQATFSRLKNLPISPYVVWEQECLSWQVQLPVFVGRSPYDMATTLAEQLF